MLVALETLDGILHQGAEHAVLHAGVVAAGDQVLLRQTDAGAVAAQGQGSGIVGILRDVVGIHRFVSLLGHQGIGGPHEAAARRVSLTGHADAVVGLQTLEGVLGRQIEVTVGHVAGFGIGLDSGRGQVLQGDQTELQDVDVIAAHAHVQGPAGSLAGAEIGGRIAVHGIVGLFADDAVHAQADRLLEALDSGGGGGVILAGNAAVVVVVNTEPALHVADLLALGAGADGLEVQVGLVDAVIRRKGVPGVGADLAVHVQVVAALEVQDRVPGVGAVDTVNAAGIVAVVLKPDLHVGDIQLAIRELDFISIVAHPLKQHMVISPLGVYINCLRFCKSRCTGHQDQDRQHQRNEFLTHGIILLRSLAGKRMIT